MKKYFLTIDNGGTNTKVVVFDKYGKQISLSTFSTKGIEKIDGFHEIDLIKLRNDISLYIKKALDYANISNEEIIGISTVGHGKGLYVLDRNKKIFRNGILSADSRAVEYANYFQKNVSDIYDISKQQVLVSQAPVLLRWLKDNDKKQYDQIGYVLSNKDFVRFLLTDEIVQEIGDASGNNLINLNSKKYDKRLLEFFGIEEMESSLPPLVKSTEYVGNVSENAADKTGLRAGTPVYAGMFDIDACAIATGVLDERHISMIAGTWNINAFPSTTYVAQNNNLMTSIFPNGKFLVEASSPTSAGNLNIMLNTLMTTEIRDAKDQGKTIYDYLEQFLVHSDAKFAKLFFFPFLYGSNVNPDAEGAFIGIRSKTTKSEMIRAVYEGIAFAHKYHFETLLDNMDEKPLSVRLSGGATNSEQWVQMFSNILNMRIELIDAKELGGLGGAIASAVGSKTYQSIEEAVDSMSNIAKVYEPDPVQSEIYAIKYEAYLNILNSLDDSWTYLKQNQLEVNSYGN